MERSFDSYFDDDDGSDYAPPFDADAEQDTDAAVVDFRPDAYEQLKLTEARTELEKARKRRLDSLHPCLLIRQGILTVQLDIEREKRRTADANRERAYHDHMAAHAKRKMSKDRRRLADAERRAAEATQQAIHEGQRYAEQLNELGEAYQAIEEKFAWRAACDAVDAETGMLRACPKCGTTMGDAESGDGLLCPKCNCRKYD